MKQIFPLLVAAAFLSEARAEDVKRNIPYVENGEERQVLDVYSPKDAKSLPVVVWIHGGGWQTGDKSDVQIKPRAFMDKGFVFVSTNYRLLPSVDMATIVRDVAKSIRWVHDHIAEYGGDPTRLLIMGHSAGAQLAALICIDDSYLKAEGISSESSRLVCLSMVILTMYPRSSTLLKPAVVCMVCSRQNGVTAKNSAMIRRNTATTPRSITSPRTKAFRRF